MRGTRTSKDGKFLCVQPGLNKIIKYSPDGKILSQADIHSDAFRRLDAEGKLRHGSGTFDYGDWAVWL